MHPATRSVLSAAKRLGKSDLELAIAARVSPASVRGWRTRGVSPGVGSLERLARVVGMRIVAVKGPDPKG